MATVGRRRDLDLPSATKQAFLALALTCVLPAAARAEDAVSKETFGDWDYTCVADGACTLTQANVEKGTENVRMRTEIARLTSGQVVLSVTLPENLLLTEGPWLTVDGLFIGPLTYLTCGDGGCTARAAYTAAQFGLLAKGARGVVTVITNSGQRIGVAMSLNGLTNGLSRLTGQ